MPFDLPGVLESIEDEDPNDPDTLASLPDTPNYSGVEESEEEGSDATTIDMAPGAEEKEVVEEQQIKTQINNSVDAGIRE